MGVQNTFSAVLRVLASHQCGLGTILRLGLICGSLLCSERVFPRVHRFSPHLKKKQHLV